MYVVYDETGERRYTFSNGEDALDSMHPGWSVVFEEDTKYIVREFFTGTDEGISREKGDAGYTDWGGREFHSLDEAIEFAKKRNAYRADKLYVYAVTKRGDA